MSDTQRREVRRELIDRFEDRCASIADLPEAMTTSDRAGAFECCSAETLMRIDDIMWCRIANQPRQVEDMAERADRSSQSGSVCGRSAVNGESCPSSRGGGAQRAASVPQFAGRHVVDAASFVPARKFTFASSLLTRVSRESLRSDPRTTGCLCASS